MTQRIAFGQGLRRERERRGIRLETIAQSTKIKVSLLDALERGDLSQWPAGIFGRGFLRAYLNAIHLPAEPSVAEFQQLIAPGSTSAGADGLRLTLDPGSSPVPALVARLGASAAEAAVVLAGAALVGRLIGVGFWVTATAMMSVWSVVRGSGLGWRPDLLQAQQATGDEAFPPTSASPAPR